MAVLYYDTVRPYRELCDKSHTQVRMDDVFNIFMPYTPNGKIVFGELSRCRIFIASFRTPVYDFGDEKGTERILNVI